MEFGGFERLSLIDYPGMLASVAFTIGCNFRCWFCQNAALVKRDYASLEVLSEEEVLDKISKSRRITEGLVITGGEPTMHVELPAFIEKAKRMGIKVKLDTNGSNPAMLHSLIERKLVDYVAMDVKMPIARYEEAVHARNFEESIKESISMLISSGIDYEFRTTVTPQLFPEDLLEIARSIKGAKRYSLQKFNPENTLSKYYGKSYEWNGEQLIEASKRISMSGLVGECELKNI
ncbi:MAG: anaerobic ribonucleoside-triphosphate reductase activating protein [Candidatus Micrarchaeaceae archaeon]